MSITANLPWDLVTADDHEYIMRWLADQHYNWAEVQEVMTSLYPHPDLWAALVGLARHAMEPVHLAEGGITYRKLVRQHRFLPAGALLMLEWLRRDNVNARAALAYGVR